MSEIIFYRLCKVAVALIGTAVLASAAQASMVLSNVILHFEPGQPTRQDIEIENTGDETMYVQVRPHRIVDPGTDAEQRSFIADPREAGLLVSPNKLVLPPRGRRLLRFVDLDPGGASERVYRVAVTPVVGDLEAEASGLKILVGYEVLVLAQPAAPEHRLVGHRDGKSITFRNDGNTNILLREGIQCPHDDAPTEECVVLGAKRLYPGNTWAVELPWDRPLEYHVGLGTRSAIESWR